MDNEAVIGESQTAAEVEKDVVAENLAASESTIHAIVAEDVTVITDAGPTTLHEGEDILIDKAAIVETRLATETLEKYFRDELLDGKTEFRVVASRNSAGDVKFYIHPQGKAGLSRDFEVMGEVARNVTQLAV